MERTSDHQGAQNSFSGLDQGFIVARFSFPLLIGGDHSAERLRIVGKRLELKKAKSEEHIRQKLPELVKKFGTNGHAMENGMAGYRRKHSRKLKAPRNCFEPGVSND